MWYSMYFCELENLSKNYQEENIPLKIDRSQNMHLITVRDMCEVPSYFKYIQKCLIIVVAEH